MEKYLINRINRIIKGIAFLLLFFVSSGLFAKTTTWNGTKISWTDNAGWDLGAPVDGDIAIIPEGVLTNPILTIPDASITLESLVVGNTKSINLNNKTIYVTDSYIGDGTAALTDGTLASTVPAEFDFGSGSSVNNLDIITRVGIAINLTVTGTANIEIGDDNGDPSFNVLAINFENGATITKTAGGDTNFRNVNSTGDLYINTFNTNGEDFAILGSGLIDGNLICVNKGHLSKIVIGSESGNNITINGNMSFTSNEEGGFTRGYLLGDSTGAGSFEYYGNIQVPEYSFGRFVMWNTRQMVDVASTIVMTGNNPIAFFEAGNVFKGEVNFEIPNFRLNGSTFERDATFTKSSYGPDPSEGGNTFMGNVTFINANQGEIRLCTQNADDYQGDIILSNLGFGSALINFAYQGDATIANHLYVNSTGGDGIYFGQNGGTTNLTSGVISAGGTGFMQGALKLRNFSQTGAIPFNVLLTNTASLYIETGSSFAASATFTAPSLFLNGGTFQSAAVIEKTGITDDLSEVGNRFMSTTRLTNSGTGALRMGGSSMDRFMSDLILISNGTSNIDIAYNDVGFATLLMGNTYVNSTGSSQGVYFGQNGGNSELSSAMMISVSTEFSTGSLRFKNFTQIIGAPQSITLTGDAAFYTETGTVWNNEVTFTAPNMYLNGSTFNDQSLITKTGNSGNDGIGGNFFNDQLELVNNGHGYLGLCFTNNDNYNSDLVLNSTATGGIQFGQDTGVGTLFTGAIISIGASGFSDGDLKFRNFVQMAGVNQNFTLTGTSALYLEENCTWNSNIDYTAPSIYLNASTANNSNFMGTTTLTKTLAVDNVSTGGNIFNDTFTLYNTSGGNMSLYNDHDDAFIGDILLSNSGGGSIRFGQGTANATLADGFTITTDGSYNNGDVYLRNFEQLGNSIPQNFEIGDDYPVIAYFQTGTIFNGNITIAFPRLYLNGATFNGEASIEKRYAGDDYSDGGNTFNDVTDITNSGTGVFRLANVTGDDFNSIIAFQCANSGMLEVAYNDNTTINGHIVFNCIGAGVTFGQGNGTTTLADGFNMTIGGFGYSAGELRFRNFTQVGNTPQTLIEFSGAATVYFETGSTFNGSMSFTAPNLYFNGSTFNNIGSFNKTASTKNICLGGNTFAQDATFTFNTTGLWIFGNDFADSFDGNVTFVEKLAGGDITVANGAFVNDFGGDITCNSDGAIDFGIGSTARLTGSGLQNLSGLGMINFYNLDTHNSTTSDVTLNTEVHIAGSLTFNQRDINTTDVNILVFDVGSAHSGAGNDSHVVGPVRKVGNSGSFTFPVGKDGFLREIGISSLANGVVDDYFQAEYFKDNADNFYTFDNKVETLKSLSNCEFWILDRKPAATLEAVVTLSWNSATCGGITDPSTLLVARWDGGEWQDHLNGGTTGDVNNGTVASGAAVTSFSPFVLGSSDENANPLPVQLINFEGRYDNGNVVLDWSTASEQHNNYFKVERSEDGVNFIEVAKVRGAGYSNTVTAYQAIDNNPVDGTSYYRLSQTDLDGTMEYLGTVIINNRQAGPISVFPNPVVNGNDLTIQLPFSSNELSQTAVSIVDGLGRVRIEQSIANGANEIRLGQNVLVQLEAGVYFVIVKSTDNYKSVSKVVVEK